MSIKKATQSFARLRGKIGLYLLNVRDIKGLSREMFSLYFPLRVLPFYFL